MKQKHLVRNILSICAWGSCFLILLAVCCWPGFWQKNALPPITVKPAVMQSLGQVWEGERVTRTFTLTNTSRHRLRVNRVMSGCGCTTATGFGEIIEAGEHLDVSLEFNSTGRVGRIENTSVVEVEGYALPVKLALTGEVKAQWPRQIDLGTFLNTQSISYNAKILNRTKEVKVKDVQYPHEYFSVGLARQKDGVDFSLQTLPTIPVGKFWKIIEFVTDDDWLPVKAVTVYGDAFPRIEAVPSTVSLGALTYDLSPPPVRIEVRSRTGVNFRITGLTTSHSFLKAKMTENAPHSIELRVDGMLPIGALSGWLKVYTDDSKLPEINVPIYGIVKEVTGNSRTSR